ncbi:hypothetical protein G9A89_000186 [Geosiphon pyriformis]|nr:hypothetical protein G9A89_000186 [Geosiphon pyriformis]
MGWVGLGFSNGVVRGRGRRARRGVFDPLFSTTHLMVVMATKSTAIALRLAFDLLIGIPYHFTLQTFLYTLGSRGDTLGKDWGFVEMVRISDGDPGFGPFVGYLFFLIPIWDIKVMVGWAPITLDSQGLPDLRFYGGCSNTIQVFDRDPGLT